MYGAIQFRKSSVIIHEVERFTQRDLLEGSIYYYNKLCEVSSEKSPPEESAVLVAQDHFCFGLETPSSTAQDTSIEWKLQIEFSECMVMLECQPIVVSVGSNVTLAHMEVSIIQDIYLPNRHIRCNISLHDVIFKIERRPRRGLIWSLMLNRTVDLFGYKDLISNKVIYRHTGENMDIHDEFQLTALRNKIDNPLASIGQFAALVSSPVVITVVIFDHLKTLRLVVLQSIHAWTQSKVVIKNTHLRAVLQYQHCKYTECGKLTDAANIIYHITRPSNGFVSRLSAPDVDIYEFSQKEIDAESIIFIYTRSKILRTSGGFRFQLSLKDEPRINSAFSTQLKIIFYPITFTVDKATQIQVSSLGICQPITNEHLTSTVMHTTVPLPPVEILYRIIRAPARGTLNQVAFDTHSQGVSLIHLRLNDIFRQKLLKTKSICYIPHHDPSMHHDSLQLLVTTNNTLRSTSKVVNLHIRISISHINPINQHLFLMQDSWTLRELTSANLSPNMFIRTTTKFLENASFKLFYPLRLGYLLLGNFKLCCNSSWTITDMEETPLRYHSSVPVGDYPITEIVKIALFSKSEKGHGDTQGFTLRIKILPSKRIKEPEIITLSCQQLSSIKIPIEAFIKNAIAEEVCPGLFFNITKAPIHGRLEIRTSIHSSVSSEVVKQIRCADLIEHHLFYINANKYAESDIMEVQSHTAGCAYPLRGYKVAIIIDQGRLEVATRPVKLLQCRQWTPITAAYLNIDTRGPISPDAITLRVTHHPLGGNILLDLIQASTASYRDITSGRVSYHQVDLTRSIDYFEVALYLRGTENQFGMWRLSIKVVPNVDVSLAIVSFGAKLILGERHINVTSLISCCKGEVLFTVLRSNYKYGHLSLNGRSPVDSFSSTDLSSNRVVYEASSFLRKDLFGNRMSTNPVLVERLNLSVSSPSSPLGVQTVTIELPIKIVPRDYLYKSLNLSILEGSDPPLHRHESSNNLWSRNSFFSIIFVIIFLVALLLFLCLVAIWYCHRFSHQHHRQTLYRLLTSWVSRQKHPSIISLHPIHEDIKPVILYNNRCFADSHGRSAGITGRRNSRLAETFCRNNVNEGSECPPEVLEVKLWL